MKDRLNAMRLLVRVVERRSFTAAAADLDIPRSTATEIIRRLESDLECRLLERTTRQVSPTPDGDAYYRRCLTILADIDDAEGALRGHEPAGELRIDAHGALTRAFLVPRLSEFLKNYPAIRIQIGQGSRLVDMVREGVDCVIRAGEPDESNMIMRRLGQIEKMTVASPSYLERNGKPTSPGDLDGHQMVGFLSARTGRPRPLEFDTGQGTKEIALTSTITVNDPETMHDLARLGYGLVQGPRYRYRKDIEAGTLVEVLPDFPPAPLPLAAFYPQNRQLSPRVRVFIDWVVQVFATART